MPIAAISGKFYRTGRLPRFFFASSDQSASRVLLLGEGGTPDCKGFTVHTRDFSLKIGAGTGTSSFIAIFAKYLLIVSVVVAAWSGSEAPK